MASITLFAFFSNWFLHLFVHARVDGDGVTGLGGRRHNLSQKEEDSMPDSANIVGIGPNPNHSYCVTLSSRGLLAGGVGRQLQEGLHTEISVRIVCFFVGSGFWGTRRLSTVLDS